MNIHIWHILVGACCQLWLLTFQFNSSAWHKTHMSTEYIATCCASSNVENFFTLPYYHCCYISYYHVCWIHYFYVNEHVCQFSSWYIDVRLLQGRVLQKVTPETICSVSFLSFFSAAILLPPFQIVDAIYKYNRQTHIQYKQWYLIPFCIECDRAMPRCTFMLHNVIP